MQCGLDLGWDLIKAPGFASSSNLRQDTAPISPGAADANGPQTWLCWTALGNELHVPGLFLLPWSPGESAHYIPHSFVTLESKEMITHVTNSKYSTIFKLLPGERKLGWQVRASQLDKLADSACSCREKKNKKTTFGPSMGILSTCLRGSWQAPMDRNGSELVPAMLTQEAARVPHLLSMFS